MDRRGFMTTVAAAVGGAALLSQREAKADPPADKPFANAKLRISAPLDWFPGKSPAEKVETVAAWGLPAYEWLGAKADEDLAKKAESLGLVLSCMGGAGRIAPGQMVQPDDHDKMVEQFDANVAVAKQLKCTHLIALSGNERTDVSKEKQTEYAVECLKRLAPMAEKNNVLLVLEMLNPLVDHKGYFVCRTEHGVEIIKSVGSPNVKLLFDIYHQQITEGNVIRNFQNNIDLIGHFHVADNPGRKEPGTGELNYGKIFQAIAETPYKEFVALECGHSTKNYEDTLRATLKCLMA